MSLFGTKSSDIKPLVAYLENPEPFILDKRLLLAAYRILDGYQEVVPLAKQLLEATEDVSSPSDITELLNPCPEEYGEHYLQLADLLKHVFSMRNIDHKSIRESLVALSSLIKSTNDNNVVSALTKKYQQATQTYRTFLYVDLQKAHVWYALLEYVLPLVQRDNANQAFAFRKELIYQLCTTLLTPCTTLAQQIMTAESEETNGINDYILIKEKAKWLIELFPEYYLDILNQVKTPLPDDAKLRQKRLDLERERLNNILFFMHNMRCFFSTTGQVEYTDNFTTLSMVFVKQFNEIIADNTVYSDQDCEAFRSIIRSYSSLHDILSVIKDPNNPLGRIASVLPFFAALGNRPRMQAANKLEAFYTHYWREKSGLDCASSTVTIIIQYKQFFATVKSLKSKKNDHEQRAEHFNDIIDELIKILKFYVAIDPYFRSENIVNMLIEVIDKCEEMNNEATEKPDSVAFILMKGLLTHIRDDLQLDLQLDQLLDEIDNQSTQIEALAKKLSEVQLAPSEDIEPDHEECLNPPIFWCREIRQKTQIATASSSIKEQRSKTKYQS